MLTPQIKESIQKSVLCWLATVSAEGEPNVSPKEIFTYYQEDVIIANIASPRSVKNIIENNRVCVSFIDILVQKGWQLKGIASILTKDDDGFYDLEPLLLHMTAGKFPFSSIIRIHVEKMKPIIAPRYMLYPETMEEEQIESAKRIYRL